MSKPRTSVIEGELSNRAELRPGSRAAPLSLHAAIVDHSPDGVLVVAPDGSIELANRAALDMFGIQLNSAASPTAHGEPRRVASRRGIRRGVGAETPPYRTHCKLRRHRPRRQSLATRPQLHELLPSLDLVELWTGAPVRAVQRLEARRCGGEPFPVELARAIAPLDDGDRLILTIRDICVQVQLEQQLARARQLEIAGRIASGIAHDLNNLLSVVGISAHLIRGASATELPELLGDLQDAVRLSEALTARLLSMARRGEGQARVVGVNDALRAISRLVERCVGDEVQLTLELDPQAGSVHIDPAKLDQLVLNLTLNGGRAMPEGGRLTIRSTALTGEQGPATVAIEVEDTGVGIPEPIQAQIFEPFFSTRSELGGTGLGLSIVKDIVDHAGGELEFDSQPGRGTRFRVTLERWGDAEGDSQWAQAAPSLLDGDGRAVLLVDDDELHRRALARLLELKGFRPFHARGAGEAIMIAEREPQQFALAVVKLEMSYMRGTELSARLKQIQPELPVLLISVASATLEPGRLVADAALCKPLEPSLVYDEVARLLDPAARIAS